MLLTGAEETHIVYWITLLTGYDCHTAIAFSIACGGWHALRGRVWGACRNEAESHTSYC